MSGKRKKDQPKVVATKFGYWICAALVAVMVTLYYAQLSGKIKPTTALALANISVAFGAAVIFAAALQYQARELGLQREELFEMTKSLESQNSTMQEDLLAREVSEFTSEWKTSRSLFAAVTRALVNYYGLLDIGGETAKLRKSTIQAAQRHTTLLNKVPAATLTAADPNTLAPALPLFTVRTVWCQVDQIPPGLPSRRIALQKGMLAIADVQAVIMWLTALVDRLPAHGALASRVLFVTWNDREALESLREVLEVVNEETNTLSVPNDEGLEGRLAALIRKAERALEALGRGRP